MQLDKTLSVIFALKVEFSEVLPFLLVQVYQFWVGRGGGEGHPISLVTLLLSTMRLLSIYCPSPECLLPIYSQGIPIPFPPPNVTKILDLLPSCTILSYADCYLQQQGK